MPPPPPELCEGVLVLLLCPLDNGCGTTSPAELGGDEETDDPDVFDRGAPYRFGNVGDVGSTVKNKYGRV